jgi:hypothetical protein
MSRPSALDDVMSSSSSTMSWELVQEITQGVQDERLTRTPAEVAEEVRLRLDRLQRARRIATRRRTI